MNANDEVVRFITEEKDALRSEFRSKRERIKELQSEIAALEDELSRIKDRLKFTDAIIERRTGQRPSGPSLPLFGRYSGKGMKESVEDFFIRNPKAISVPDLAEKLVHEGLDTSATTPSNLQASVFTTCKRLSDSGYLSSFTEGRTRFFKLKRNEG